VLVDWMFADAGWLFAAGVLCRSSDRECAMVERAQAVFATWHWIGADARSAGPPSLWSRGDSIPPAAA
jgi:hypothetical protein